jgi:hypothetical protein
MRPIDPEDHVSAMVVARGGVLVALIAACSCGGGGTNGGGAPLPSVHLLIEPSDGATAWAGKDIVFTLNDPGPILDDSALADLASRTRVAAWPDGTAVSTTIETGPGLADQKWIRVRPIAPLQDHWHVIELVDPPVRITTAARLDAGTIGSRFRPGSHPRVAKIDFCEKESPGMKLAVTFSELVTLDSAAADVISLRIAGAVSACQQYDSRMDSLFFVCDDLSPTDTVGVSVGAGIAGMAGVPLDPVSFSIDVSKLPAGACRSFAPPL